MVRNTSTDDGWPDESAESRPGLGSSWAAVLRDVRTLAIDMTVAGVQLARHVPTPPLDQMLIGFSRVEDVLLRQLKARLDQLERDSASGPRQRGQLRQRSGDSTSRTPAELLDGLLGASIEADSTTSRIELYQSLLMRLVPDEARILAALSDGTPYPLVHVQVRANGGRTVLANASTVGRAAGVLVIDAAGTYVAHLRALGLAEEGPEDDSLSVQYDILLGDAEVRHAEDEAKAASRLGARLLRRTLRVSQLGAELWQACRPDDLPPDDPTQDGHNERGDNQRGDNQRGDNHRRETDRHDSHRRDTDRRHTDRLDTDRLDADGVAPAPGSSTPERHFHPDTAYRPSVNGKPKALPAGSPNATGERAGR